MNLKSAILARTVTADGLCALGTHVRVGELYFVDLDRVTRMLWGHVEHRGWTMRDTIWIEHSVNGTGQGWMPAEFFLIHCTEVASA